MLNCPWCGAQMGPVEFGRSNRVKGYRQCSNPKRVEFCCDDPDCDFRGGLPLHVVDEAIYTKRPTLLIGTVDKFALLPWYPEARSLFGLDTDGRCLPPDLVIQDELHLISGPLGSMVGHYETAIDALCTHERDGQRISAKIIASTATICRAGEQVQNLYGRPVFLFPPQGLKAGESFFAHEDATAAGPSLCRRICDRTFIACDRADQGHGRTSSVRQESDWQDSRRARSLLDADVLFQQPARTRACSDPHSRGYHRLSECDVGSAGNPPGRKPRPEKVYQRGSRADKPCAEQRDTGGTSAALRPMGRHAEIPSRSMSALPQI